MIATNFTEFRTKLKKYFDDIEKDKSVDQGYSAYSFYRGRESGTFEVWPRRSLVKENNKGALPWLQH